MKKATWFIFILILGVCKLFAQDCNKSFYMVKGREVTFTNYGKNGQPVGKDVGTVLEVAEDGGKLKAQYRLVKYEADGKIKEDGKAEVICENGNLLIGFQVPDMKNGGSSNSYFTYPANMKPGQALEAKLEMTIKGETKGKKMDVYFKVENRKVVGKEQVKVLAGNYEAFKIEYDMTIKFKVLGIGIPMKIKVLEWFSPGIGVIKTELSNKEGVAERSELSSIK